MMLTNSTLPKAARCRALSTQEKTILEVGKTWKSK